MHGEAASLVPNPVMRLTHTGDARSSYPSTSLRLYSTRLPALLHPNLRSSSVGRLCFIATRVFDRKRRYGECGSATIRRSSCSVSFCVSARRAPLGLVGEGGRAVVAATRSGRRQLLVSGYGLRRRLRRLVLRLGRVRRCVHLAGHVYPCSPCWGREEAVWRSCGSSCPVFRPRFPQSNADYRWSYVPVMAPELRVFGKEGLYLRVFTV